MLFMMSLIGHLGSFVNDWLILLQQRVGILSNILINVLYAVDMSEIFSMYVVHTL